MTRRELGAGIVGGVMAATGVLLVDRWPTHRGEPPTVDSAPSAPQAQGDKGEEEWRAANASLAESVKVARDRLAQNERDKQVLEAQLSEALRKLSSDGGDSSKSPFDLTKEDWMQLAKSGTVRAEYPCAFGHPFHMTQATVDALGLSPDEVPVVERAYDAEQRRLEAVIQHGCAQVLGNEELAVKLGPKVCSTVISSSVRDAHAELQHVADIRAGNEPELDSGQMGVFEAMILEETHATRRIQDDIAATLGPDEAHRLAYARELGSCTGSWEGQPAGGTAAQK